jgi:hypothetical protein
VPAKTLKISNPSRGLLLGSLAVCCAALLLCQRAHAFGGLWSSQSAPIRPAGEAIIFVDNPDSTITAIIQMQYAGPPQRFAWLIPVPGIPTVGVASNTLFQRLDAATAPDYWLEVGVEGASAQPDDPALVPDAGAADGCRPSLPDSSASPVVVIDQGAIGPYDYVNITVDPSLGDPAQLASDWLALNGYDLAHVDGDVLRPYLKDGLNLLAFKLSEGTEVGALRPVVLTYESERPMIPIQPTAVAAQADMGIRVWVFGPAQAVPANYKSLVLDDALIDWLSGRRFVAGTLPAGGVGPFGPDVIKPRNYDAVVTAAANEAGGQGFVTELGGPASQYRDKLWSSLDEQTFAMIASQSYEDGVDAIVAANNNYAAWDGWREAIEGAATLPADLSIDEFSRNPDAYRGVATVDAARFLQLLDEKVVRPLADTAALFYRAPYLTRLYTTMSSDEMTLDPSFDYNFDLAQVSNVHIAKQFTQCSAALNQDDAPSRIELPQGGVIDSDGSGGWPVAEGSLPANLKIVALSTSGSGRVIQDNSADIRGRLRQGAGTNRSDPPPLQAPQNGVMIGGSQTLTARGEMLSSHSSPKPASSDHCGVSHVHGGKFAAPWLPLAGLILALRRRRSQRQEPHKP